MSTSKSLCIPTSLQLGGYDTISETMRLVQIVGILASLASTLIETQHSESLITVWTAQRHVPCWDHLPFMKGQDDTIIVRRLQAVVCRCRVGTSSS